MIYLIIYVCTPSPQPLFSQSVLTKLCPTLSTRAVDMESVSKYYRKYESRNCQKKSQQVNLSKYTTSIQVPIQNLFFCDLT